MDQAQVFLAAGLVCTLAFASFVLLDSDSEYPDWEVLEVCLAEHRSDISHIHATLSITINGNNIQIPDEVGIEDEVCPNGMRGVHTHDDTGRLHIETPGKMNVTAGAFFAIWGEEFDDRNILNKVANDNNEVVMFVNGQQNFEYENYVMEDGDVIEIEYRERQ
jgi:hypothetical protein